MKATKRATQHRKRANNRLMAVVIAVVLAAITTAIVALRPDGKAVTGYAAAVPTASGHAVAVAPTRSVSPSASGRTSASATQVQFAQH